MARQSRLLFPPKSHNSTSIFELLYVDLWGPYHTETHDNFKYLIILVDDFSILLGHIYLAVQAMPYMSSKPMSPWLKTSLGPSLKQLD